jgi:hypothetical protein
MDHGCTHPACLSAADGPANAPRQAMRARLLRLKSCTSSAISAMPWLAPDCRAIDRGIPFDWPPEVSWAVRFSCIMSVSATIVPPSMGFYISMPFGRSGPSLIPIAGCSEWPNASSNRISQKARSRMQHAPPVEIRARKAIEAFEPTQARD